jgi:uncharacterized protein (DUF4415 family)
MKEDDMNGATRPMLPPHLQAQAERIAAMREEDIDLSDMPEVLDWSNAVRGKFYRPVKQQVTLRLDADVIDWFKRRKGDAGGYQTLINTELRKLMDEAQRKTQAERIQIDRV